MALEEQDAVFLVSSLQTNKQIAQKYTAGFAVIAAHQAHVSSTPVSIHLHAWAIWL